MHALLGLLVPNRTVLSAVLLSRPGLARTTRAYGAFVRKFYATTRLRDQHVKTLSYWSDNAAGYSWWSMPGNNIDSFGPIGELFIRLHKEYLREGIMFGSWESDNTFGRIPAIDSTGKSDGGWCFEDWTAWNLTQYPGGGSVAQGSRGWPARMRALQNATIQTPMAFCYYIYFLCHDNVWRRNESSPWHDAFVDAGMWYDFKHLNYGKGDQHVALLKPERSYAFYTEIMQRARDEWGMTMLFKDDLAHQGQDMMRLYPDQWDIRRAWLGGLTRPARRSSAVTSRHCCNPTRDARWDVSR